MKGQSIDNINIISDQPIITPKELKDRLPIAPEIEEFIKHSRQCIRDIIHKQNHRLLIICGPCSIHDIDAAIEYAKRLKKLHDELSDVFYIVMRVYFEKPRTTVGWKGLVNDPRMDGTFDIELGLTQARKLLISIAELEIPVATEALDPITPQYLAELFSWSAIGARTTESQTHREMASGLSMPVGFKNGTNGELSTAINAMKSAASPHCFIGVNQIGQVSLMQTNGNSDGHVILRGGQQPNFDAFNVAVAEKSMLAAKLNPMLMIDCSHANSHKDHNLQPLVAKNATDQIIDGNKSIIGFMLESNLNAGNQSSEQPREKMKYGVSVTDACIDWETTEELLRYCAKKLKEPLKLRILEEKVNCG
ncbi:MAG: 3-deoxy-7-phosphoheptulonate synthase [Bdellovibrionaceae bacterium]|nr:3-deoxy-7-phosphoheptulonate synthase [Pseudobdellovibrionaceae bacterium]